MTQQQGFYGKLPSRGDFLRRGLPDSFVMAWDGWLQQVLAATVGASGSAARDAYRAAPTWRFVLGPDLHGEDVWAGVLAPSEDRVGRVFPFCAAIRYPGSTSAFRLAAFARDWLDAAGGITERAVASREGDPDDVARALEEAAAQAPPMAEVAMSGPRAGPIRGAGRGWRFPLPANAALHLGMVEALEELAREQFEPLSLWWTEGAGRVEAQWRCEPGWPSAAAFGEMFGLAANDRLEATRPMPSLRHMPDRAPVPEQMPQTWLPLAPPVPAAGRPATPSAALPQSAVWTTAGKIREENEDAYMAKPAAGLWAVADGLGGHQHGEVASRVTVATLDELALAPGIDEAVEQVTEAIGIVNRVLRARRVEEGVDALTTVVSLIVRGRRGAVLWVGDSRLYRQRRGRIECLTRDHAWPAERANSQLPPLAGLLAMPSGVLSRAIGAEDTIDVACEYLDLEPGDCLLLCSDGVYGEVAEPGLVAALSELSAEAAIGRLKTLVEASEAHDNATAVVVVVE